MKKFLILITLAVIPMSCSTFQDFSFFTEEIGLKQLLIEKENIDKTDNPAKKFILQDRLGKKYIVLKNIKVKEINQSSNIDYDFSIQADIDTPKGKILCIIYTKNVGLISELEKGKSVINVKGRFSRFFSLLDEYYTIVEINKSKVKILEKEKK